MVIGSEGHNYASALAYDASLPNLPHAVIEAEEKRTRAFQDESLRVRLKQGKDEVGSDAISISSDPTACSDELYVTLNTQLATLPMSNSGHRALAHGATTPSPPVSTGCVTPVINALTSGEPAAAPEPAAPTSTTTSVMATEAASPSQKPLLQPGQPTSVLLQSLFTGLTSHVATMARLTTERDTVKATRARLEALRLEDSPMCAHEAAATTKVHVDEYEARLAEHKAVYAASSTALLAELLRAQQREQKEQPPRIVPDVEARLEAQVDAQLELLRQEVREAAKTTVATEEEVHDPPGVKKRIGNADAAVQRAKEDVAELEHDLVALTLRVGKLENESIVAVAALQSDVQSARAEVNEAIAAVKKSARALREASKAVYGTDTGRGCKASGGVGEEDGNGHYLSILMHVVRQAAELQSAVVAFEGKVEHQELDFEALQEWMSTDGERLEAAEAAGAARAAKDARLKEGRAAKRTAVDQKLQGLRNEVKAMLAEVPSTYPLLATTVEHARLAPIKSSRVDLADNIAALEDKLRRAEELLRQLDDEAKAEEAADDEDDVDEVGEGESDRQTVGPASTNDSSEIIMLEGQAIQRFSASLAGLKAQITLATGYMERLDSNVNPQTNELANELLAGELRASGQEELLPLVPALEDDIAKLQAVLTEHESGRKMLTDKQNAVIKEASLPTPESLALRLKRRVLACERTMTGAHAQLDKVAADVSRLLHRVSQHAELLAADHHEQAVGILGLQLRHAGEQIPTRGEKVEMLSSTFAHRLRELSFGMREIAEYLQVDLAKAVRLQNRRIKKGNGEV